MPFSNTRVLMQLYYVIIKTAITFFIHRNKFIFFLRLKLSLFFPINKNLYSSKCGKNFLTYYISLHVVFKYNS